MGLIPIALAFSACGMFRSMGGVEPGPALAPMSDRLPPGISIPGTGPQVEPNPDATWVEIASLTGESNLRSEAFQLSGVPVRLRTTLDGDIALLVVFLMSTASAQAAGFPDVITTPGEEETLLARPAGTYYLDVQSFGTWRIVVEEEGPSPSS